MLNTPIFTLAAARLRALELLAMFNKSPDTLSPDEQALAMYLNAYYMAVHDHSGCNSYDCGDCIGSIKEAVGDFRQ